MYRLNTSTQRKGNDFFKKQDVLWTCRCTCQPHCWGRKTPTHCFSAGASPQPLWVSENDHLFVVERSASCTNPGVVLLWDSGLMGGARMENDSRITRHSRGPASRAHETRWCQKNFLRKVTRSLKNTAALLCPRTWEKWEMVGRLVSYADQWPVLSKAPSLKERARPGKCSKNAKCSRGPLWRRAMRLNGARNTFQGICLRCILIRCQKHQNGYWVMSGFMRRCKKTHFPLVNIFALNGKNILEATGSTEIKCNKIYNLTILSFVWLLYTSIIYTCKNFKPSVRFIDAKVFVLCVRQLKRSGKRQTSCIWHFCCGASDR